MTWGRLETAANQRAVVLLRENIAPTSLPPLDDLALGQQLRQAFNEFVRNVIRHQPEIEPHGPSVVMQILSQWGIQGVDLALSAAIFEAMRVRIPESRSLFADTYSTLTALQQLGFLLGVVSNRIWGGQPFQEDIEILGLHRYFQPQTMAISADLGVRKPSPVMFWHALNALNVLPEESVMVGDSLSTDIVGAQALGIFATWKPKPEFYSYIRTRMSTGPATRSEETAQDKPLAGMHVTDDDFVLARDQSRDYLDRYLRGEIQPDLVIEHLSDLLDIFTKVGVQ